MSGKIEDGDSSKQGLKGLFGFLGAQKRQTPSAAEEIKDFDNEEMSENESLNLSKLGRQMIEKALERNNGNRKKAADELGISDRTLYRRIKKYGLGND